ncbi:Metal dependent phosphohydrolase, HD region [hydrothermal vent metagenome]|uniref:Metal dependent phosphohydrolase, HD region n=1 Tax=hydrothermal vent metagenome TaxID=652676 RepID=A0A3B0XXW8_9ZZZZ
MTEHSDRLNKLNRQISLHEKLVATHQSVSDAFPFIVRIAIAIYDAETGLIKTYLHSSGDENPLSNYQAYINDVPSLKSILEKGQPRIINNFLTFEEGENEHTKRIGRSGYVASYTLPMFNEGEFYGFIFFNSDKTDVFTEKVLQQIDVYAHMISLMVINEISSINKLSAAVKTTGSLTHIRDPETGSHLDRMSRYSRLIAAELADKYDLDDSYIEHLFMFSPLHDIGKIGIPDNILLKPGRLDDNEKNIMQTHTSMGRDIIDELLKNFNMENLEYISMLRNIAEFHHESINGKGYPTGIKGSEIPVEARIVAVADVFDALVSERPYKEAWSNDRAFEMLKKLAGEMLDRDCVDALLNNIEEVEKIQKYFNGSAC